MKHARILTLDEEIVEYLSDARSILIVGLSRDENKTSNIIARKLSKKYEIYGVNPNGMVKGIVTFSSIEEASNEIKEIDVVDIFRPSEEITQIVGEVIESGLKTKIIWMQEGIKNVEAAEIAVKAGINVVMDRCIYKTMLHNNML